MTRGSSFYAIWLFLIVLAGFFVSPAFNPVVPEGGEGGDFASLRYRPALPSSASSRRERLVSEEGEGWEIASLRSPLALPSSASSPRERLVSDLPSAAAPRRERSDSEQFSTDLLLPDELGRFVVPFANLVDRSLGSDVDRPGRFFICENGTVGLMDSRSQSTLWEFSTGSAVLSFSYLSDDSEYLVIPGRGSDLIEIIDGFDQKEHDLSIKEYISRTPEIKGSTITIGSKTSTLYTVAADSGEIIYKHNLATNLTGLKAPMSEETSLLSKLGSRRRAENTNYINIIRTDYSLSSSNLGRPLWNWTKSFFTAYYHSMYELPPKMGNKLEPLSNNQQKNPFFMKSGIDKLGLPSSLSSHDRITTMYKNQAGVRRTDVVKKSPLESFTETSNMLRIPDTLVESSRDINGPELGYDDFPKQSVNNIDLAHWQYSSKNSLIMSGNSFKSTDNALAVKYYADRQNPTKMSSGHISGFLTWLMILSIFILSAICYLNMREPVTYDKQLTELRGKHDGVPKKRKARKAGTIRDGFISSQHGFSTSDKENSETDRSTIAQINEKHPFMNFGQFYSAGDGRLVGKLFVSNTEIGRGSNGTVVLEGFYDGRPVAVKRLLHAHHDIALKEIQNLIASDQHPNIVRWYGVEQDLDFVYISLERCSCSLAGLVQQFSDSPPENPTSSTTEHRVQLKWLKGIEGKVELWRPDGRPSSQLLKLMRDVVSGLAHLHELGIIHRDLKPQNVLISTDGFFKAKLSDMGISKRLQEDMSSLSRHATGYGSSGWQAPEQLLHGRQTRAVDLFSLGCIIFYCITKGKHPFGEYFERDMNIIKNRFDLFVVDFIPEAVHLLSQLLDPDPKMRPKAVEVLHHPFFWSSEMRLSFLRDTSDRVDKASEPELLNALEHVATVAFGGKWGEKLDALLVADLGRYRKYNFDSMRDLLRVIRNKSSHYRELPSELQEILGPLPEGFDRYFSSRFPKLLIEVYKVVCTYCRQEDSFSKYFQSSVV
ncbi:serine/threonine-protein kinase/endoribonuclease IRE1-like isoform X1 [Typha angustifolia]|uniref:serine/threonine-protein kinase/endoribonuclease IRE1-like isoform X1 n=1 Tax=Typha angustifolia TaxID=59011 RepID=UPI003C2FAF0A